MQRKTRFLISLILISLNINCQNQKKDNSTQENNNDNMIINLIEVDFENDLEKILSLAKFTSKESEFSEYLYAQVTTEVELFKLGSVNFTSKFVINSIDVPNDSYVSFSTVEENNKKIQSVHVRYNFLGEENYVLSNLKKQFGEPKLLSTENSINAFKGNHNYIWKNIQGNRSVLISQFTEGSAFEMGNGTSKKINSTLIYIFDDASIIYPNGQKEKILERLVNRFSE